MLQKKLEENAHSDFTIAFTQSVLPILKDLMTDQFGNYLCQKIMEVASDEYLMDIVENILDSIN